MLIKPPGQDGLAGQLASLQQQVNELSRADDTWRPTLTVKLPADSGVASGPDAFIGSNWTTIASGNGTIPWTVATNSYATLPIAGRYLIHFHVSWAQNATGIRACKVYKNGTTVLQPGSNVIGSSAENALASGEGTVNDAIVDYEVFNAGDVLYFSVYQNSGATLNIKALDISGPTNIHIRYLGPT